MSLDHAEIKDRFHLELGRLVHAHSVLDFNVGIALGWLGPHNGKDVKHLLVGGVQLAHRLSVLKPLVLKTYQAAGKDALAEFQAWFARAHKLKAIRNDYVHARWGLPGHSESDDPVVNKPRSTNVVCLAKQFSTLASTGTSARTCNSLPRR